MHIKFRESATKANHATKAVFTADGPDDETILTALIAAFMHGRNIYVCKTEDPNGRCFEYTPATEDARENEAP